MDIENRKRLLREEYRKRFGGEPEFWVRAPGRVDLMGSHTDYNQGYVMTTAIDRDIWMAGSPTQEAEVSLYSINLKTEGSFSLEGLPEQRASMEQWLRYPAGVAEELLKTGRNLTGFKAVIHSTLPIGSGLSSSAAFEAAAAYMVQAAGNFSVPKKEMALICQKAENNYAGMNCGILDQYSSILAEEGATVLLDCRSISHEVVPYAGTLSVVICNTNAPRQLTGSEYGTRRGQCEEGVSILKTWYPDILALRDVTLEQLAAHAGELPKVVEKRCRFIIQENQRVLDLAKALRLSDKAALRGLYVESFEGARDLYEISVPAMERMMEAMMAAPGVIGGRNAGAGFGGCMVALVETEKTASFAEAVKEAYDGSTGLNAEIYPVKSAEGAGLLAV